MNRFFSLAIFVCIFFVGNIANAYNYTEQQKNMFYNEFLKGYMIGINIYTKTLPFPENKKQMINSYMRASINRQELINSSWDCVKTKNIYNPNEIKPCMENWAKSQGEKLGKYMIQIGATKRNK